MSIEVLILFLVLTGLGLTRIVLSSRSNQVPKERNEPDKEGWIQNKIETTNPTLDPQEVPEGITEQDIQRIISLNPTLVSVEVVEKPDGSLKVTEKDLDIFK